MYRTFHHQTHHHQTYHHHPPYIPRQSSSCQRFLETPNLKVELSGGREDTRIQLLVELLVELVIRILTVTSILSSYTS